MFSHQVVPGLLVLFLYVKCKNPVLFLQPYQKALPHYKCNVNKRQSPDMVSDVYNIMEPTSS